MGLVGFSNSHEIGFGYYMSLYNWLYSSRDLPRWKFDIEELLLKIGKQPRDRKDFIYRTIGCILNGIFLILLYRKTVHGTTEICRYKQSKRK